MDIPLLPSFRSALTSGGEHQPCFEPTHLFYARYPPCSFAIGECGALRAWDCQPLPASQGKIAPNRTPSYVPNANLVWLPLRIGGYAVSLNPK